MSHPTLRILAFSPAAVNAGICRVPVNFVAGHSALVEGSVDLLLSLAREILRAAGVSPAVYVKPPRKPGSGRTCRITPERLTIYRAVQARVQAGALWKEAAAAEGVNYRTVFSWHWQQARRAAAHA